MLAGLGVVIVFGYAFSWLYAAIGLATKDPETAQVAGVLPFFVLMFASNAIVPVSVMPGWLQGFARNQPLSVTVSAVRALLEGGPAAHWAWQALVWSAGICVVFFAISVRLYHSGAS
jgi:ABC-2 type transport system permease protein/oleandomycin transport system permease protein